MPLYEIPPGAFGTQLRRVREFRGLSQTQLATEIGVVNPYISQWEAAKSLPRPQTIAKLEQVLRCLFRCDDKGNWTVYHTPDRSALVPLDTTVHHVN